MRRHPLHQFGRGSEDRRDRETPSTRMGGAQQAKAAWALLDHVRRRRGPDPVDKTVDGSVHKRAADARRTWAVDKSPVIHRWANTRRFVPQAVDNVDDRIESLETAVTRPVKLLAIQG